MPQFEDIFKEGPGLHKCCFQHSNTSSTVQEMEDWDKTTAVGGILKKNTITKMAGLELSWILKTLIIIDQYPTYHF